MKISAGAYFILAFLLLVVPLPWLQALIMAAAVHELGHYYAIRLCTGDRSAVRIYSYSALLPLPPMSSKQELLCALAGPFAGLCLLLLGRWLPRTAVCAAAQSIYNLIPIYPLDGGRALRCVLRMCISPPKAAKVETIVAAISRMAVIGLAVYAAFWLELGVFAPLLAVLLLIRTK